MKKSQAILIITGLFLTSLMAQAQEANYDESLVGSYTLPDAMTALNGQQITKKKQWEKTRRPQILKLFQDNEYGIMPDAWAKSCLDAHDLCYFNFEHEESAAQPNWSLARKEPWFELQSYEWPYEEGSIGRKLETDEWQASQAFQAFAAWESMKLQTIEGVSGFSWCSMESGPNMFTYQKPLIDPFCVPKLAFYANRMAFQPLWAASDNVDTVYGPTDSIAPVIFNLGKACEIMLIIELQNDKGKTLEKKVINHINVPSGRSVTNLQPFRFRRKIEGCCFVVYKIKAYST